MPRSHWIEDIPLTRDADDLFEPSERSKKVRAAHASLLAANFGLVTLRAAWVLWNPVGERVDGENLLAELTACYVMARYALLLAYPKAPSQICLRNSGMPLVPCRN